MSAAQRRPDERQVTDDRARMIIHDQGEPWPDRLTAGIQDQNVQLRVIGLPERIGARRSMSVQQLVTISKGSRSSWASVSSAGSKRPMML